MAKVFITDEAGVDTVPVDGTRGLKVDAGTAAADIGKEADSVAGSTDTGIPPLAIRDDSLSSLTPAEGDYVPIRVNSTGALHVTGGGGGTEFNVDDAGGATDAGSAMLVIRDDALTTLTPADGDYVRMRVNSTGALHVTGGGGGTEYNEDDVSPNPIVGTATLMERDDALSALTPVEGDFAALRSTAEGALWTQDFNSDAIRTAVELIDNAISGSEMQVDVVASLPAGTNNIGDVDIASALPAGTNNIGDVDIASALPAGTNNIGDVDILSLVPGTGATNLGSAEDAVHGSGDVGVMSLAVRNDALAALAGTDGDYAPLQVDASGALFIQEGAAMDVSAATVTVDLGANNDVTLNASTANIGDVDLELNGTAVSGNNGTADAGTIRVTVASDSTGVLSVDDNGGNISIDDGGNVITIDGTPTVDGTVAHDALDSGGAGPVKIGGRAQNSEAQPEEVADNDRVDALFDRSGYLRVRGDFDPSFADINDSVSGNNTIIAAQAAGKRIAVWAWSIVSDGTVDCRWEDGAAGTAFTGQYPFQAREGISVSAGGMVPLFVGSAATLLNLELSAAVAVHGNVSFSVIDD